MNKREFEIVHRWMEGQTFATIGKDFGISGGRAAQIKDRVFSRIGEPKWFKGSIHPRTRAMIRAKMRWLMNPDKDKYEFGTPAAMFFELQMEHGL